MGRSCCVPGCKSNYTVADTSTFKFPKDETLREIWLRNIHREDFEVKSQTVVCVKHFEPKFVVREDIFPTEYGEPVRITRKIPKLTNDAIPTIFPDPPSYRAVLRPSARRERVKKVISRDQRNLAKWCDGEGDVISNSNDFKGMNLRAAVGEAQEESPTSDYVDDSASEPADSTSSSGHSPSPAPLPLVATVQPPSKLKHPQHMPYDPLVHVNSKPPYSFSCLIFMAIEDSPNRALPVKEIYAWILQHFPYFKNAPTGWKNSVRHNLSLNKCFRKVEKAPNLGKGSLWMVDSVYRPNLLQALQKSPFYPFRSLDRVSMATKHVHVPSPVNPLNRNDLVVIKPNSRLPNPELFPFLSRRLAASGVEGLRSCEPPRADSDTTTDDADSLDDGDAAAATAMLALKHGPRMLSPRKPEWYKRPDNEEKALDMRHARKRMRASKNTQDLDGDHCIPVITTSPSEDHTYSAGHTVLPTSSPDEAYEEGSESEDDPKPLAVNGVRPQTTAKPSLLSDAEEQRKIAEGADALLNLAGITTRKRSQSSEFQTAPSETTPETPVSRVSLRGRRRGSGGVGFRPRLLRSVRPVKKSSTASSSVGSISVEPPRQRVAHRRKSQNPVNINTNNNTIDAGTNNNNNIAKVAKTLKQMQRNTNENEGVGRTKR